ncbi:hypothetical protein BDB01DRAFT_614971 [Pilobolus umbonatus]|nr:hypothetical protein BDB01DRAFT_614971 [Pilobolus umbonatus]
MSYSKRDRSPVGEDEDHNGKRVCHGQIEEKNTTLLSELSEVLNTIKSTPSSGEISAEVMETFKILLLEIEHLSADETNIEAKKMKYESDLCLESWFDDLLARCEAEGELDLDDLDLELSESEEEVEDAEDAEDAYVQIC